MIYFIITLKSKQISNDFAFVSNCVTKLIAHLLSNSNDQCKVILTRHELPFGFKTHERLIDLDCSNLPVPFDKQEMMVDKVSKLERAYEFVKKNGYGVTMQIDYDDSISLNLLQFLFTLKISLAEAYYLQRGYVYPEGSAWVYVDDNIYRRCGSTWIVHWRAEDFEPDSNGVKNVLKWGHHDLFDNLPKVGFTVRGYYSLSCLYRTDNGENHSDIRWKGWHGKKRFVRDLLSIRFFSKAKRNEFGVC